MNISNARIFLPGLFFLLSSFSACDKYELIRKDERTSPAELSMISKSEDLSQLQEKISALETELQELKAKSGNSAGNGRYQLVLNTQNSRSSFLLDTKLGVAWMLRPDAERREDVFTPIGFRGGFSIPTLQNSDGDVVLAEKEIENMHSLAEVHQYVKQVRAQDSEKSPESSDAPPPAETARASLGRGESPGETRSNKRSPNAEQRAKIKRDYWRRERESSR